MAQGEKSNALAASNKISRVVARLVTTPLHQEVSVLSTRYLRRMLAPSLVAALATVTACGGDDDGPTEPTPAITVGVAPPTITAVQGETKTATVTITRTNFTGPVNLTLESVTAAATAASDPAAKAS